MIIWIQRIFWVGCLLLSSCFGGDVGNPCQLPENAQKTIEELAGKEVRIAVPSFECSYNYCFATFYDSSKEKQEGYCSKPCEDVDECPSRDGYICAPIIELTTFPAGFNQSLQSLSGQKVCQKLPPQSS